jgi:hypothetical protein
VIVVAGLAIAGLPPVAELFRIDDCLDRGGSYNYETSTCDLAQSHAVQPFANRHRQTVVVGLLVAACGLLPQRVFSRGRAVNGR